MEFFLWLAAYTAVFLAGVFIVKQIRRQIRGTRRAPAPPLNPRWDTSVCKHAELIPVEISTGEVVAYICKGCDTQVDVDAPAATRSRIQLDWTDIKDELEPVRVELDTEAFKAELQEKMLGYTTSLMQERAKVAEDSNKTKEVLQAEQFAARVRAQEKGRIPPKQEAIKLKRRPKGSWM
jgi:hypothetical protein